MKVLVVVVVVVDVALEADSLTRVDCQVGRKEEVLCVVTEGSVEVVEGLDEGCEEEETRVFVRNVGVSMIHTE